MSMTVSTLLLVTALSAGIADPGTSFGAGQEPAPPAQSGSTGSDADRIRQRVTEGQQVRITDDQGQEWRGRISALSADTLTIVARDRQPAAIAYGSIVRIDRPNDSLANGALIGFTAGAALGLVGVITEEYAECEPEGFFSCGDPSAAAYVLVPAVIGGLGAAVGVGIDALIRRDPNLYRRAGGARMTIAPAVGHGRRGVAVALRW